MGWARGRCVGRGFPAPPGTTPRSGGHMNARPTEYRGVCRSHLFAILLVLPLLLFLAPICCLGAGEGGAPSGPAVRADAALEVGEMDARLAEALNAFGAGRYEECRKLAEAVLVGRGFPAPPKTIPQNGGAWECPPL
jgi:hypothetical protein